MHVHRILGHADAEFVGPSIDGAWADSGTSHPCAEGVGMMVAAVLVRGEVRRGTTEFGGEDDERIFQESPLP